MPPDGLAINVTVRSGVTPDRLLLVTNDRDSRRRLYGGLRRALPEVRWHVAANGISVDALQADPLATLGDQFLFEWTPEAQRMLANRLRAKQMHPRIKHAIGQIVAAGRPAAEPLLGHSPTLDVLDDHQWVNVACMTLADGFGLCLFDEQGAGKTVTTVFALDTLVERDEADFALIVAPKSMIAEWPNDFGRFTGSRYEVRIATGPRSQKRFTLASDADVLVTNFETVVQMEAELRSVLARYGDRAVLVVDESFYAKNLDAQRTLALRRLREWCRWAFVLCGTPAPNAPHDLVQQFNLVDFGITFAGVQISDDRDAARPVIQRAIERRGLFVRHLKEHVLPDLPTKTFSKVIVPLQPLQSALYRDALNGLVRDLQAIDDDAFRRQLPSFLARRMALLQICSHPVSVAPEYTETPAKILALDSLLEELITRRGEKVIVWSFFTASIDQIVARYHAFNLVRYDGTITDTHVRRDAVCRFQDDTNTMLLVANPAAAGAGLTLHRARYAIYESLSNQAAHYLQSIDRIHRRGQTRDVEYLILLCESTIEVQEYDRLTRKERSAKRLLGDPVAAPVTRDIMLADTLQAMHLFEAAK